MFSITINDDDGGTRELQIHADLALIGKARSACVRLSGWRVGREHARIVRGANGLMIEDLGQLLGTWVNGSRIAQHGPLHFEDEIVIGAYRLRVRDHLPPSLSAAVKRGSRKDELELPVSPRTWLDPDGAPQAIAPEPARAEPMPAAARVSFAWRKRVHERLLDTIDLRRRDLNRMSDDELRVETAALIREIIDEDAAMPAELDRGTLCREVLDEAIGLGPLEPLLEDPQVTEIMVNRFDEIFVERDGRIERHPVSFTSDRAVLGVIERIVAPIGRRIDESSPMVDARLKDGSRVNAVIPPLALKGPTLTVRKFACRRLGVADMLAHGSMSAEMAAFLRICVEHRRNLIVSGGTGSGKTTLLNLLSGFIPDGERIITIEDAAELRLVHSDLVSLESRPTNLEGRGAVTIRELVRNALRMRPDRIVVGECRGGEALDMLQAMNTGHEGSLTTLHANSPRDAIARLETLVLMAGVDLPLTAIREQIASAIDIIVQQTRFACGTRRITSIAEVTGIEGGRIQLQELFRFERRGGQPGLTSGHTATGHRTAGYFTACDTLPGFYDELRGFGVPLDLTLFERAAVERGVVQ